MKPSDKIIKGDCDCCPDSINVVLYGPVNSMMMCESCFAKQAAVTSASLIIEESHAKDQTVKLDSDVWVASTTSFVELNGAIQNNPEIKDEEKYYALVQEAVSRIRIMNEAIFNHDATGITMKNERNAWVANTQQMISKLRADQREHFKNLNVNYDPKPISKKATRSTSSPASTSRPATIAGGSYTHKQVVEACKKYGADVRTVSMMLVGRAKNGLTPDLAAQEYVAKNGRE